MAEITKKVDRAIPSGSRYQTFSGADVPNDGDIILVEDSLGRAASRVDITPFVSGMQVRFNVRQKIFNRRTASFDELQWSDHLPNMTSGHSFIDATQGIVYVNVGNTLTLDGDIPVSDIEITVASGDFHILVM